MNISCTYTNTLLKQIFVDLGKKYDLYFYYTDQQVKDVYVTLSIVNRPLNEVLRFLLANTQLDYTIKDQRKIIIKKKNQKPDSKREIIFINGYIKNTSGENVIGAHVQVLNQKIGVTSNDLGYYCIGVEKDTIVLEASYVGHELYKSEFCLKRDTTINLVLFEIELGEVTVIDRRERLQESTQMSKLTITHDQLKMLPSFLGVPDIIKTIQMMPGVQSGVEGEGYLYVRGGSSDQNLILWDNVPVYQSSHALGLVPFFNSTVINHAEVLKGGFPARYSGRISSVIDIDLKNGNDQEYHGNVNISPLMSELMMEGPIIKGKTSFIVSGRRTYIDLLARKYINSRLNDAEFDYHVFDINARLNHKISDKENISMNIFKNQELVNYDYANTIDNGNINHEAVFSLNNAIVSLRWNKLLTKNLFGKLQFFHLKTVSDIKNSELVTKSDYQQNISLNFISTIKNNTLSFDFLYVPENNHTVRFGLNSTYQIFQPSTVNIISLYSSSVHVAEDVYTSLDEYNVYGLKAYVEDDYTISSKLRTNMGINCSFYHVDTKNYFFFEPRIAARYLLSDFASLKLSYSRMHQYTHLLANYSNVLPTELWVPSNEEIRPILSNLYVSGLSYSINHQYEISMEGYYKTMSRLISFKDGTSFDLVQTDWKKNLTSGSGRSYGYEVFIQKTKGTFKGWIGYTLSWTERQFDELNDGDWFPYKYDRRHDINLTFIKTFLKKFEASASWVYGTGNAISIPLATYDTGVGPIASIYTKKNAYRLAPYHRLDINIGYIRVKNKSVSKWSFGLYNAYNRMNPFFIRYDETENKFVQYSLFPVIPTISYNYKF